MTSMSRQHFQLIADTLYDCRPDPIEEDAEYFLWQYIVGVFCVNLRTTNELFDEERFRKACGLIG